jgi:hypothetical protein
VAAGPGRRVPPCPDRAKPVPPAHPAPSAHPARSAQARPVPPACPVPPARRHPAWPAPLGRPPLTHHTGRGLSGAILILTLAAGPRRGCG